MNKMIKNIILILLVESHTYAVDDMKFLQKFVHENKLLTKDSNSKNSPFYQAVLADNVPLVKKLSHTTKLNFQTTTKNPLCVAVLNENKEMLTYLVSIGFNPRKPVINQKDLLAFSLDNPYKEAKLFNYSKQDIHASFIEYLIKKYKFDVNGVSTKDELLYLNIALKSSSKNAGDKVAVLLKNAANPNELNHGAYPLQYVAPYKSMSAKVKLLIKYKASINNQDIDKDTAIHQWLYDIKNYKKMIKKYKNSKDNKVHIATTKNHNIQDILDNTFGKDYYYKDAIYKSYKENTKQAIKLLIDSGADISLKNKDGISVKKLNEQIKAF